MPIYLKPGLTVLWAFAKTEPERLLIFILAHS